MSIVSLLKKEWQQELGLTRAMLALVPETSFTWKPHEKSMSLLALSTHIAEIPSWIGIGLRTEGIDFATFDYKPTPISDHATLMQLFEKNAADSIRELEQTNDDAMDGTWVMRMGETILSSMSKYETIRHAMSQTIHHRAQLGVYLRLLNIPIPGTYGPSADSKGF